MTRFPANGLWRLARKVANGEVVFFIGAGFSLDSEGNSTGCLIRRLLARFLALTESLQEAGDPQVRTTARDLLQGLCKTFKLAGKDGLEAIAANKNVESLAREYYHINDWISSAFGHLLAEFGKLANGERHRLLEKADWREAVLLEKLEGRKGIPLQSIDIVHLLALEASCRGKALFLDTMGFNDEEVIAGRPMATKHDDVAKSYGDRLKQRHNVLAWLAREGLCSPLVTTNYDLLIEGAYRLAGSTPCELKQIRKSPLPPSTYEHFSRIASAEQFFSQGAAYRSAMIVKIHGCAEIYRNTRSGNAPESLPGHTWKSYLPAMVFTYREIQNWRDDSWSRDFLRTLLRTRTLAFVGYSGMDPVLHDTFRTVYEEMARYRGAQGKVPSKVPGGAPAFFFGLAEQQEFHCMEILRAASAATGTEGTSLTQHPNYLPFWRKDSPQLFPTLDESMLWLFHLVFRQRQWQALDMALRRTAALVLDHPGAEADIAAIRRHFLSLWRKEVRDARLWARHDSKADKDDTERQQSLDRIIGWTTRFQTGLLREFALAEGVVRHQGPGFDTDIETLRRRTPYHPANDHPDWTAWGAVLEIATRRLIASWRKQPTTWAEDCQWVRSGSAEHTQIFFARGRAEPTPSCLTIRLTSFDRVGQTASVAGVARTHATWQVHPDALPWSSASPRLTETARRTPPAEVIWRWASDQHEKLETHPDLSLWPDHLGGGIHG
jgi:hypothetical protein